jgi:hypothetical protein
MKSPSKQLGLVLSGCQRISDVSGLRDVHALNLAFSPAISDVSALGSVHTLDLSESRHQ